MSKLKPWLLVLLVVGVYLLHQDFWNWNRIEPVFFGFVPVGLGYHAIYSMVAAGLMWLLVRLAWPAELEAEDSGEDDPNKGERRR